MPTHESATSGQLDLAALRARILSTAPDPALDTDEFRIVSQQAAREIATGQREARAPEIRVRIAGRGVSGHELSVVVASEVLANLQGAITAVGSYVRNTKKARTPKRPDGSRLGVRAATEFRMTPTVSPGSIIFHLRGATQGEPPEGDALFDESTDTLADVAVRELLTMLGRAQEDMLDDVGELSRELRRFGAAAASKLDHLAKTSIAHDLELDLGHRSVGGTRRRAVLGSRGAHAIRAAAEANRKREDEDTLYGVMNTASDGHDLLRLTLDDGQQVRLRAEPVVGASMGALLGQRVAAEVTTTIRWNLSRGRETRTYELRSAEPAPLKN